MSPSSYNTCPLCHSSEIQNYFNDKRRDYLLCTQCCLVFVPPEYHLNEKDEKKIYDLHENDLYDGGYRRFLSRLADPLTTRLPTGARGLDFGCGPGPALVKMLEERGFRMSSYDKFYENNPRVLSRNYDFICATEVVEHLQNPALEFKKLFNILKPSGTLGLMTKLVKNKEAFTNWHYIQDQSHICFYSRTTFRYLANLYDCRLEFIDKDVVLFQKISTCTN